MKLLYNADFLKFAITLFSVLNPLGAIPVFATLTDGMDDSAKNRLATTSAITVFFALLISAVLGNYILNFFGIQIASFRLGGGILIGSMAFSMLQAKKSATKLTTKELDESHDLKEIGIVPLAIPMLAGPGTISTAMLASQKFHTVFDWIGAVVSMLIVSMLVLIILRSSSKLSQKLGKVGINVMTRIMGLILMAMAVEFIVVALKILFPKFA
jgi:multiple antibiotic resistance protein